MQYTVNVRAVVTATREDPTSPDHIDGWEIYDFDSLDRDESGETRKALIRCDRPVTVEADNPQLAAEEAKLTAPTIMMPGWLLEDVRLWVDEGIDIAPAAQASSVTP